MALFVYRLQALLSLKLALSRGTVRVRMAFLSAGLSELDEFRSNHNAFPNHHPIPIPDYSTEFRRPERRRPSDMPTYYSSEQPRGSRASYAREQEQQMLAQMRQQPQREAVPACLARELTPVAPPSC